MLDKLKKIYSLDLLEGAVLDKATLKLIVLNVLCFAIPFLVGDPQLLVGSIVNFILIYFAFNFKGSKMLPAIFLPAIASLLRTTLLGPLNAYLAVLMPFIWVANGIFILSIRAIYNKNKNLILSLFGSAIFKAVLLFVCTFALVSFFKFPSALLIAMGILQLATASIASLCYLIIFGRNKKANQLNG